MRLFILLWLCGTQLLCAHDSPEHVIESLTRKIKATGATPQLLYERAVEYRALRRYGPAARDLEAALKLDPRSPIYCVELARVYAASKQAKRALTQVNDCIAGAPEEGPLFMARAEIHMELGNFEQALKDCQLAFKGEPEFEWYLIRSRIEAACGQHEIRVKHLVEAIEETGSGLLEIELVESLLDAGKFGQALEKIEPQLENTRWRSSWLIRKGWALAGMGKKEEAKRDFQAAAAELQSRMRSTRKEASLVADLAICQAFLGKGAVSVRTLAEAEKLGLDNFSLKRAQRLIQAEKTL